MASSLFLLISAFPAMFLLGRGCSPSNDPTSGDKTLYSSMKFTMKDVNLDARWTGNRGASTAGQSAVPLERIRQDIDLFVDGILGEYNLPQGMVSTTLPSSDENKKVTLIKINVDGKCEGTMGYTVDSYGTVVDCSTPSPEPATFTITGDFRSTMGGTQSMWNTLADKLQKKLTSIGFVQFNQNNLTVEPVTSV